MYLFIEERNSSLNIYKLGGLNIRIWKAGISGEEIVVLALSKSAELYNQTLWKENGGPERVEIRE